jgi:hypothetical protein
MYLALLASSEGAAGAPVSPFEVNPGLIIWTWFVFGVLFLLLKKYAWPAILSVTEEREETIRKHLAEAEQAHAKAQALLAEQQKLPPKARRPGRSSAARRWTCRWPRRRSSSASGWAPRPIRRSSWNIWPAWSRPIDA